MLLRRNAALGFFDYFCPINILFHKINIIAMSDEQNNNDFPEKDLVRQEAVTILLNSFKQQKQGKQLSRTVWNFWNKARTRASQDLVADVERLPEEVQTANALNAFLKEEMTKTMFFMSVMGMVETFKQKG